MLSAQTNIKISSGRWRALALKLAALVGALFSAIGIWQLQTARSGVSMTSLTVGSTPATVYRRTDVDKAPVVIIAHGFAGSRQLMEAYALTLARAGYVAVSFDFYGHGRNPEPMSGDVGRVDGTTKMLMREIGQITDAALALPSADGRVALLGHSMASDVIVRRANEDRRVVATVAISMFSEAVTSNEPKNLLMISGAWEPLLRKDALRNARLADPSAAEGVTTGDPANGSGRRTVVAPNVEHVSVLYSSTALREARAWLDALFRRSSDGPIAAIGPWIVLLLAGLVLLAWPLANLLPTNAPPPERIPLPTFVMAVSIPTLITPLALRLVDTHFLPVLVADYLTAHLFLYGAISIGVLLWRGVHVGRIAWLPAIAFAGYGIFIFGGALDRYVASFMAIPARVPIIAAIAIGAVSYGLADAVLTEGGRSALWRVLVARLAFLFSLGAAVALNLERLFFLLIIIPVILLFFIVFGFMGGAVGRRTLSPAAVGIGSGLILAWAIGVSFPMFVQN